MTGRMWGRTSLLVTASSFIARVAHALATAVIVLAVNAADFTRAHCDVASGSSVARETFASTFVRIPDTVDAGERLRTKSHLQRR